MKGGLNEGWVGGKWVLVGGLKIFLVWFKMEFVEMAQRVESVNCVKLCEIM